MGSLVLCYAAEDEEAARRLGEFLEANIRLDVSYGEGVVRPDFDILAAVERGLSAEAALVLLSPDSAPKTWRREEWEPVFFEAPAELGARLGFVLLRECRFPELLKRQHYFDLTKDFVAGARQVKQWLLHPHEGRAAVAEDFGDLRAAIADRPGTLDGVDAERARGFAAACRLDFEAVHRIDLQGRSRAGIIGDIGYAVGLCLAGTVEENREALVARCRDHRYLFIFENLCADDRAFAHPGGRSSAIFADAGDARERAPLPQIGAAFFNAPRDEAECMALLGDASSWMKEFFGEDFEAGLRLGWAMVAVLNSARRFAEAVEVLDAMGRAARQRGDEMALFRIQWEQSWLRDDEGADGGMRILPTAAPETAQLTLGFE